MKKTVVLIMIVSSLFLIGCSTHIHTVGTGPQTGQIESARQWYILYGLIPLNTVDTGAMAGGVANYIPSTKGILGKYGLTQGAGSFMPTLKGAGVGATLAPFAMQATGNWKADETFDNLKL